MSVPRILGANLAVIALLAGWWSPVTTFAEQTNDGPKILFLTLKLQNDHTVKPVSSVTRPGELKPPANTDISDGIHYKLLDADGKTLWHAASADPSRRVLEYADRSSAGKLKHARAELSEGEFMVRLPVLTNAVRVEFYRSSPNPTNQTAQFIRIGAVPLPPK